MSLNIDYTYCPPKPDNYVKLNRTPDNGQVKGIVFHWTANLSKTADARANAEYYCNGNTGGTGSHFFVDDKKIYASTPESCQAGAIGKWQASYYLSDLRNANTISIELIPRCLSGKTTSNARENDMYFDQGTIDNAVKLGRYLINKYHIKKENVIRHYDVYGSHNEYKHIGDLNYVLTDEDKAFKKWCPLPWVGNFVNVYWNRTGDETWEIFRDYLFTNNEASLDLVKRDQPLNPNYKHWVGYADRIENTFLNVRTGAGVEYPNLASYPRLAQGNKVEIISETYSPDNRMWYQISIAGKYIGFVRADYITPVEEIYVAEVVKCNFLIVRKESKVGDNKYDPYPYLAKGNMVDVLDSSDQYFAKIRIKKDNDYHIAYASKTYLKKV